MQLPEAQIACDVRSRAGKSVLAASVLTALLIGNVGCSETGAETAESKSMVQVRADPTAFREEFQRIGAVVPQQSEQEPIVRLSGMDIRGDGAFLIGDVSESQVKLFDRGGRILVRIGRRGSGPGEFHSPRYPRFGRNGRIYVADAQVPRIQVFEEDGSYVSEIILDVPGIQGFEVLEDGSYVILASTDSTENILHNLDDAGRVLTSTLPIARVGPDGRTDHHPAWGALRSFSLAMRGDTAFVTSSASNRLWQVHLTTGEARTFVVDFDGYIPPRLDKNNPPGTSMSFSTGRRQCICRAPSVSVRVRSICRSCREC